jgi:hypothetical protein
MGKKRTDNKQKGNSNIMGNLASYAIKLVATAAASYVVAKTVETVQ